MSSSMSSSETSEKFLDEIERISDFVGDSGGEFAHFGEFLLGDNFVLGETEFLQHALKLVVPLLQDGGQFLYQVQALHFEGVLPEDLEGGGHVGDFVVSADFDLGFEVASGHSAHPAGQNLDTSQKHAANEEPGYQEGSDKAEAADSEQEGAASGDGLHGSGGRLSRAVAGGNDEAVHLRHERDRFILVFGQQASLAVAELEFSFEQGESVLFADAHFGETREDGGNLIVCLGAFQAV